MDNQEEYREPEIEKNERSSRPRRFGRGIYDKKDAPIRLLDKVIGGLIAIIFVMVIVFALNGGYRVSFDTGGGTEIPYQKLRYGQLVQEPEAPERPGYVFDGWYYEGDADGSWDFTSDKVGGDLILIARWKQEEKQ